ncbi:phospholipid-transporting ATPase ABCA3 [Leptinotarsa decemlineata]|uniref:phospholipid-transporting ATPase ABCA3 n=1 Tax=Leptinotarsa decemlineata TaxID=7539 RepID=UPI003D304534
MRNKFRVVIWKNFIIRRRHWFLTILESLLPIALFFLIAYGRSKIDGLSKKEVTYPSRSEVMSISKDIDVGSTYILYTPENNFTTSVMKIFWNNFQIPSDKVFGFGTEVNMVEHYHKLYNYTIIAIVFSGNDPKNVKYTIRYHENRPYYENEISTNLRYLPPFSPFVPGQGSNYYWKGLISVQNMLDLSFIQYSLNMESDVTIEVQEFPYPPYILDSGITNLFLEYLPVMTIFSFIFLCPAVLKRVVEEKHSGIKELLKMVGMESWMLWLGWMIYGMVPIFFSVSIIVFLMKVPIFGSEYPPIEHSNFLLLFFFLLFYCMTSITLCFAISSFFSKPTTAMVTGILIWILSYCVPKYSLGLHESNQLSWFVNILLNLLPNMALHYGYSAISVYEERGLGIQWNNFYQSSSGGVNDVTMLNVFVMLWFDMLLFVLFTFYMDGVNPGKYGVRKSLLFPIYHLVKKFSKINNVVVNCETLPLENIEEGRGMDKGIEIHKLYKRYGSKMAVSNLNLDIYKNQITVLLGHNGAGKSTTMSMITGMLEVTSGSIIINGSDIKNNMDKIRQNLGLCPQHNLFFTDLTVREHLLFFAKLKGRTSQDAALETDKLLKDMNLYEKRNSLAHTLSGGMKRKLCLGMSLVGGSNVLILDEPSSGMDPESRRQLWDLLLSWRGEKTILVTTHFMEEADALGDWIAIMADGALQCYGTPMFLKKRYDTGYHLSLILNDDKTTDEAALRKNKISLIRKEVDRHIHGNQLKSQDGNHIVFVLPFESNTELANLLEELEKKKNELGIANISVTVTTLEDVFLKARVESSGEDDQIERSPLCPTVKLTSSRTKMTISTLLMKKYLFMKTKRWAYIIPLLIALLFFSLTVYLTSQGKSNFNDEGPSLAFRLNLYGESSVFYNGSPTNSRMELLKSFYRQAVEAGGSEAFNVVDVEESIIEKGEDNIAYYKEHMIAAANFFVTNGSIRAVAMYNAVALHSLPISLNLITNAIVKTLLGSEYSISTSYWPLESIDTSASPVEYSETMFAVLWLIMIPIGCLFILGSFIIFPHTEISTRFIQLQYMCGVKPVVYWITNFLSDLVVYFIMIFPLTLIVCLASPPFRQIYEFGMLLAILIVYGMCGIPFTYLFTRKSSASGAFALLVIMGIFWVQLCHLSFPKYSVGQLTFRRALSWVKYTISSCYYKIFLKRDENTDNIRPGERDDSNGTLKANKLFKTYSGKQIVKNIDFTLQDRECLGILGVNGAGKTTTFRMLTREEIVDNGQIHLLKDKKKININQDEYMEQLGYCPQADTLNFILTGREILTVIAQLRGIENYKREVDYFLEYFDLEKYADQPCGHYSGGNKRKLSLAVSIIGFRKVVLLDEPTNGVDPSSRRKCWKLIKGVQEEKNLSFILTSHSMMECEALCNKLKIMKEGEFVEQGSLSELKKRFGGFTLKLKLFKSGENELDELDAAEFSRGDPLTFHTVEEIKDYFTKNSRGELKDEHAGLLHFYIKGDEKNQKWSTIFREVENIKSKNPHLIEDYNISEASLEDVFLKVARSEGEENTNGK